DTPQDTTFEQITASARRLITYNIGINGTVGYERNEYQTLTGEAPAGANWSIGADWAPTPRTSLAASMGHRYFGATHSLDFKHRTRLTVWNLNYSESVTTSRSQLLAPGTFDTTRYVDNLLLARIPDPVERQAAVQQYITQTGLPATLTTPVTIFTN